MLKETIVTNTWKCDSCGVEIIAETNPFFSIMIDHQSVPNYPSLQVDLCQNCIQSITIQSIVDYVANFIIFPS